MKHADTIAQMTLAEKVALVSGLGYWRTKPIERLSIPSLFVADGPHGLRRQEGAGDHLGLAASQRATCFPTASALAASWDVDLLYQVGQALGCEARAMGVHIILGPGVNMKRDPLCGRNFEYFSEDPFLAGQLASAWIEGVQAQQVGVSLKHFACNNQETQRMGSDSLLDERALREYYLPAFETAVKKAQPATLMSAYNKVNGVYCSDSKVLLQDILREEWGFEGLVMSDWGGTHDRVAGIAAGMDLEMPDSKGRFDKELMAAVREGRLDESLLDASVDKLLELVARYHQPEPETGPEPLFEHHHNLARQVASQCAVLLKNEGQALPLPPGERLCVIGELARTPRYQGTGSSQVSPSRLDSLLDGLDLSGLSYDFAPGYTLEDKPDEVLLAEAVALASQGGQVILCLGLTERYESEGFDRASLSLPRNQLALMDALHAVNPRIVVVLSGGGAVELPFAHKAQAILHLQLSGQAGGLAAVDLLTGQANPSGKLAESYALHYSDHITSHYYLQQPRQVPYYESLFVGYRFLDAAGIAPQYPFGHGLSYTQFDYSGLQLTHLGDFNYEARFAIKNTGQVDGAEIAQLYIAAHTGGAYRPVQELKGFAKVHLRAGESQEVCLTLNQRSFATYKPAAKDWQVEAGTYAVRVGASSRDIRLEVELAIEGVPAQRSDCDPWYYNFNGVPGKAAFESIYGPYEAYSPPGKGSYTLDSSIADMARTSRLCRLLLRVMEKQIAKVTGGQVDYNQPEFRMMMDTAAQNPIRTLALFLPEQLTIKRLRLIVAIANGLFHYRL